MSRITTIREFILDILINQTKEIAEINNGKYRYQAFALECISIELLGKVLSGNDLFKYIPGQPQTDFESAIQTLFPQKYHIHKTDLYKELRCGMLHTFGPKHKIVLGDKEEPGQHVHLSFTGDSKLILLFKEFHKDFSSAAQTLLALNDKNIQAKLDENFLNIGPMI